MDFVNLLSLLLWKKWHFLIQISTLISYIFHFQVQLRGALVSLLQLFDCFAYLIEYIAGSYVSYEQLIIVSAALPLLCFFTFMCIPESPYQLHNKGKERKALKALHFFRGHNDATKLQKDINEMQVSFTLAHVWLNFLLVIVNFAKFNFNIGNYVSYFIRV